jgi:hypothetical protein
VEDVDVDGGAGGGELGEGVEEAGEAVGAGVVDGDGEVGFVAEGGVDPVGEGVAGSDLDEGVDAGGVEPPDLVVERGPARGCRWGRGGAAERCSQRFGEGGCG